jgi:hypothetical protein
MYDPTRLDRTLSRRDLLRLSAAGAASLALSAPADAALVPPKLNKKKAALDLTAGTWQPWLVPSVPGMVPAAPPKKNSAQARAEILEIQGIQSTLTDRQLALIELWDSQGGVPQWSKILLEKIRENRMNPVLAARAMALLNTAIADAVTTAWEAKFRYKRLQPAKITRRVRRISTVNAALPAYVSEHAAVAAAAATVLNYLWPSQTIAVLGEAMTFDEAANAAAYSRMWAGVAHRSDVEAGLLLGQAVGFFAVGRGSTDGSAAVWDAVNQPGRPLGPQYWVPTAPGFVFPPLFPLAGAWNPWLLRSGDQFRPPTPPALLSAFPSASFLTEAAEVKSTVDNLTPQQRQIALYWADDPGTYTPPGHWMTAAIERTEQSGITAPRAARALALFSVAMMDAAIACWESKYFYWTVRPITAIQTMTGRSFYDPTWMSVVTTPPFPTYVSGHSTFSGSASEVLEFLFPGHKTQNAFGNQVPFREAAEQAAISRLYGGIHFRSDNEQGLILGRKVAGVVLDRARTDNSFLGTA